MTKEAKAPGAANATEAAGYTLWQLVAYMLGLGTWGFGGPVALVGYMYRDLVEKRGWIAESDYKEGMALAQLMPGPLAAQLAIYLGYVHYRLLGATLVGLAFVLPSFLMVVALGATYLAYGGIGWMQSVFYGVGAAVIGIIAMSAYKLTTKNVGRDKLLWVIFLVSAAVTVITQTEVVWMFLGAGVLVWLWRAPPAWLGQGRWPRVAALAVAVILGAGTLFWLLGAPVTPLGAGGPQGAAASASGLYAGGPLDWQKLGQIGAFFTYAGSFVFGSGLAIVPFLYSGVVQDFGWLNDRQFVDAVAVAMITPGPVVITTGFIGYLVAGVWGAVVAAVATFLPCYLLTVLPAPYFKKHGKRPAIVAFVDGVTAAAVGAIAGAVIVIGQRSITDWITAALAVGTAVVLWRFKKLQEPVIVLVAALIGLVVHPLLTST
ncbi:chromate transporter [Aquabacterium sp. A7-Y]|uniref:chromate transporter n=1 Tax=Aquabacterium sp. A7-Y TaxID=1349605 RepID=UPI00223E7FBE|nr:chromate transporter [Aquabacterium sp. A7-Y]MCW7541386.1 chromate transporter [Aquabacterium sp. A7-Y]